MICEEKEEEAAARILSDCGDKILVSGWGEREWTPTSKLNGRFFSSPINTSIQWGGSLVPSLFLVKERAW